MKVKSLSHVRLLATPRTTAYQAPLSMGFSRQEYWSGLLLPSPLTVPKLLRVQWGWLEDKQAMESTLHLRAFARATPSAWNTLLPTAPKASYLSSL